MDIFLSTGIAKRSKVPYKDQFEFFKKFLLFQQYSHQKFEECKHEVATDPKDLAFISLNKGPQTNANTTVKDLITDHFRSSVVDAICKICKRNGKCEEKKHIVDVFSMVPKMFIVHFNRGQYYSSHGSSLSRHNFSQFGNPHKCLSIMT